MYDQPTLVAVAAHFPAKDTGTVSSSSSRGAGRRRAGGVGVESHGWRWVGGRAVAGWILGGRQ